MNIFRKKPEFVYLKSGKGLAVESINRFSGMLTVRMSQFGLVTGHIRMNWAAYDAIVADHDT